ncbi:MAG: alpha/beta fold hydrolase [Burkholderiales bacterium]
MPFVLIVFSTIQMQIRESRSRQDAAPAHGRFVRAHDVELAIQESGLAPGPVVLFIHGLGAWSETWRGVMDALVARGMRVIAVDFPPFGCSEEPRGAAYDRKDPAQRILALLDALNIDRATFVAHSVGGRPAPTAALAAPDRVERLVLVDVAPGFDAATNAPSPAAPPGLAATLFEVRWIRNGLLASVAINPMLSRTLLVRFVADPGALSDQTIGLYQRPLSVRGTTNRLGDWLVAFVHADDSALTRGRETYRALTMPTVVV